MMVNNNKIYLNALLKAQHYLNKIERKTIFSYSNELGHILDRKPKIVCANEAVNEIKSNNVVFCSGGAATPIVLIQAMVEHAKKQKLKDITVCHMHTEGEAEYTLPENAEHFRTHSFFMGANMRKPVQEGRAENISIFLQDIPRLFYNKIYQPDVALIHVSMPDKHGFCSLGCSVDCIRAGVMHSKYIIAQMNQRMPRTFGDALIHSSHFDVAIEVDRQLPQHTNAEPSANEAAIAKLIAENLVPDGATLQTGIGSIPDMVLSLLKDHKDLGIHTELMSTGAVDLMQNGAVTNGKKPKNAGRTVVSFLLGTDKLYNFINDNPMIELMRVDYVNSLDVIKKMPNMVAINACIEVDLTGQVSSDSAGQRFISGFGGQVDFIRGAFEAYDGKGASIITLQSTTKDGKSSKIVPILQPGAGVVTTRAHVNYVVTEHGIASLFGKTMPQRAYELIQIAHPDHRENLEKAAFKRLKIMPYKKE